MPDPNNFKSFLSILSLFWHKTRYFIVLFSKKQGFKDSFTYINALTALFIFGFLVISANFVLKTLSSQNFPSLIAGLAPSFSSQNLFAESPKNFLREFPEMTLLEKNSLVSVAPPVIVDNKVLGIISDEARDGDRKEIIEYNVEQGDTLSLIAENFGLPLDTILWANDLTKNSIIRQGDKLIILPVPGLAYLVKSNDTLSKIAKEYKGELEEIIAFNNLSNEGDIFIGDLLIIPNGKMPKTVLTISQIPVGESYFIFPVEGKISKGLHGILGNGVDVANKCGKPVVASASGIVQRAGIIPIGGKRITILHSNGVVTYYGHLSKILVVPGEKVQAGDIIGYIGNSGYTLGITGCHLHFETRGAGNFLAKYSLGSYLSWKK